MKILGFIPFTACKTACKQYNLLIIIYSSIPVRSTSIPLGRNSERDFCNRKRIIFVDIVKDNSMKTIEVTAAIIIKEGKVFATQRGYGDWKGWWEFPGGKMEPGETPQEALRREILEELDAEIGIGELLDTVEWDYPAFHLTMHCFLCTLISESMHLNEHEDAAWLSAETLHSVKWLPADEGLIPKIAGVLA